MSALDTEKGQFLLAFSEPIVPVPKSVEDYKTFVFAFDTRKIHAIDQIELHKQAGEMIYSTLTSSTMATTKLQASLNNIHSELKIERMSSLAKDTRIKAFEALVIKLGYDPSDIKAVEEISSLEKVARTSNYRATTSQINYSAGSRERKFVQVDS